ncbi:hypothetical protein [Hydrogenoanaerobacterium sp.]|uniref:hypothetical protein n=1 Tax=Hydrogenoanaerobacterium sp. TaxID=2953763 RepID=UPI0028975E3E|nr:hypothetical protein [Hydrogenoanaerobacterium sp.]
MHALFIVLNDTDYLDDILAGLVQAGVTGATILESQGMAGFMMDNDKASLSMANMFKSFLTSARPFNKTIFTVLESDALLDKAVAAVRQTLGEEARPGTGMMFSVPIGAVYPLSSE